MLLNNFDQEVIEKVKVSSENYLNRYEEWLWQVTKYFLEPFARFETEGHSFVLHKNPFDGERIHPGPYRMGKRVNDVNTYRTGIRSLNVFYCIVKGLGSKTPNCTLITRRAIKKSRFSSPASARPAGASAPASQSALLNPKTIFFLPVPWKTVRYWIPTSAGGFLTCLPSLKTK